MKAESQLQPNFSSLKNPKKIIHIDMDCFFAAVEMRDNPKLKNIPMAVGGSSRRSVLCTANYEARKYGIGSAMSSMIALKKCPKLVIIKPNGKKYSSESKIIFDILHTFSNKVQPLSLDEAYVDVSHLSSASLVAQQIRQNIFKQTALTASAGVSYCKFLAKIASDWNKPNGQFTISPDDSENFLRSLCLTKLPGVGPATYQKLLASNLRVCGDLIKLGHAGLIHKFGQYGQKLWHMANGIDLREVDNRKDPKSLSLERTFESDYKYYEILQILDDIVDKFLLRLDKKLQQYPQKIIKSLFLKIKFFDHQKKVRETALNDYELNRENIIIIAHRLINDLFQNEHKSIRLIGIGARLRNKNENNQFQQLKLFS